MRELLAVARALSDGNRARVVMFLRRGELCLCQIIEMLGLAPSTVSRHMTVLRRAGLVEARKDGRWIYYRLPGRGASPCVRAALPWVRRQLESDPRTAGDDRRRRAVCRKNLERLCACYKK
jgi:DNA-binding transcriptional ArsR family regulator